MYCENPTIILNPNIVRDCYSEPRPQAFYYAHGEHIKRIYGKLPTPKQSGVTLGTLNNWFLKYPDGEIKPIYMLVPCGHCLLCRCKKVREWATRATCESAVAEYPPLFLTLTYEDSFLPDDGLCKEDVQNFLKRFRIYWKREFNSQLNLRYIAVGEYGSHFGRPHYHLLLWNVPHNPTDTLSLSTVMHMIEYAWSYEVSDEQFLNLPDYVRVQHNGKLRQLIGRIDLSPDKGNSAAYCVKYMKKPQNIPEGKNPNFMLSSRGNGGIGVPYLDKHFAEFQKNPQILKIPVGNNEYSLPRVFKERLFPPVSRQVPAYIRFSIERFSAISNYLIDVCKHYRYSDLRRTGDILELVHEGLHSIRSHYGHIFTHIVGSAQLLLKSDLLPQLKIPRNLSESCVNQLKRWSMAWSALYQQLREYQPKRTLYEKYLSAARSRESFIARYAAVAPEVDVSAAVYSAIKANYCQFHREIF